MSRKDCSVPRGEPHRPHFKMEHGLGLASTGNATVRLPHCSQVGLKVCLSIEAMFISILMFRTSKLNDERLKTYLRRPPPAAWAASLTYKFWIPPISATMERI